MMFVPPRAFTVNPKRIARAASEISAPPPDWGSRPFGTQCLGDLYCQIPTGENLHLGIDKILAGGTNSRIRINLIYGAPVDHVTDEQFRLGLVNRGKQKKDGRRGADSKRGAYRRIFHLCLNST